MKKNYESPKTEYVELDTQNVLLASTPQNFSNKENQQNSSNLPIDSEWN